MSHFRGANKARLCLNGTGFASGPVHLYLHCICACWRRRARRGWPRSISQQLGRTWSWSRPSYRRGAMYSRPIRQLQCEKKKLEWNAVIGCLTCLFSCEKERGRFCGRENPSFFSFLFELRGWGIRQKNCERMRLWLHNSLTSSSNVALQICRDPFLGSSQGSNIP